MRIGVDGSCWSNRRGFGRFTRALVDALANARGDHEIVLVADDATLAAAPIPAGVDVARVALAVPPATAAAAHGSRSARDMYRMSMAARRARVDVFWFPATYSYYPVFGPPVAVTVHDAIAERLPDLVVPSRADRARWWLKQRAALRQARIVFTVSAAARDDVEQVLRVPASRLRVLHEAPDARFRPAEHDGGTATALARFSLDGSDPYLLYVGGISPHKNLLVLIDAFERVAATHDDVRLVLAGDFDDDPFLSATNDVRDAAARAKASDRIVMTGYVDDDDLVDLYRGATVTVQPSLAEGFGLTAAESVACGTPVVASDIPALVGVLGDAGTFVPPHDPAAFAHALGSLLDDRERRAELARRGLERARTWSWEQSARTLLAGLEEIAATR